MKATEQYFPVVLFIMQYKVVLSFKFVVEILRCDQMGLMGQKVGFTPRIRSVSL